MVSSSTPVSKLLQFDHSSKEEKAHLYFFKRRESMFREGTQPWNRAVATLQCNYVVK